MVYGRGVVPVSAGELIQYLRVNVITVGRPSLSMFWNRIENITITIINEA